MNYLTNDMGDIYAEVVDNASTPYEPESFGWHSTPGPDPERRRSIDQLSSLPGFSVVVTPGPTFEPGPRPERSVGWLQWQNGAAPPAAALSKDGVNGTLSYHNRLSDALGEAAAGLSVDPGRSPFLIHDFVGGREIRVHFAPPPVQPGGVGVVYLLDDEDAIKIGHTTGYVAARVADLQTGNPRLIKTLATVGPATSAVEAHLHAEFGAWSRRGEWFDRTALHHLAESAGGWEQLLRQRLPAGNWDVQLFP